jgi:hypothetical protein
MSSSVFVVLVGEQNEGFGIRGTFASLYDAVVFASATAAEMWGDPLKHKHSSTQWDSQSTYIEVRRLSVTKPSPRPVKF